MIPVEVEVTYNEIREMQPQELVDYSSMRMLGDDGDLVLKDKKLKTIFRIPKKNVPDDIHNDDLVAVSICQTLEQSYIDLYFVDYYGEYIYIYSNTGYLVLDSGVCYHFTTKDPNGPVYENNRWKTKPNTSTCEMYLDHFKGINETDNDPYSIRKVEDILLNKRYKRD